MTLEQEVAALERVRILEALERSGYNHTHTARDLGLSRVELLKKMDRMGLRQSRFEVAAKYGVGARRRCLVGAGNVART